MEQAEVNQRYPILCIFNSAGGRALIKNEIYPKKNLFDMTCEPNVEIVKNIAKQRNPREDRTGEQTRTLVSELRSVDGHSVSSVENDWNGDVILYGHSCTIRQGGGLGGEERCLSAIDDDKLCWTKEHIANFLYFLKHEDDIVNRNRVISIMCCHGGKRSSSTTCLVQDVAEAMAEIDAPFHLVQSPKTVVNPVKRKYRLPQKVEKEYAGVTGILMTQNGGKQDRLRPDASGAYALWPRFVWQEMSIRHPSTLKAIQKRGVEIMGRYRFESQGTVRQLTSEDAAPDC